jgi:hypothetical protein
MDTIGEASSAYSVFFRTKRCTSSISIDQVPSNIITREMPYLRSGRDLPAHKVVRSRHISEKKSARKGGQSKKRPSQQGQWWHGG